MFLHHFFIIWSIEDDCILKDSFCYLPLEGTYSKDNASSICKQDYGGFLPFIRTNKDQEWVEYSEKCFSIVFSL